MIKTLGMAAAGTLLLGSALSVLAAANNGGGAAGQNGQYHDWTALRGCSTEQAISVARSYGLRDMRVTHAGDDRFVIVGTLSDGPASMVLNRETPTCKILRIVSL